MKTPLVQKVFISQVLRATRGWVWDAHTFWWSILKEDVVGGDTGPREEGVLGDRRCTNHGSKFLRVLVGCFRFAGTRSWRFLPHMFIRKTNVCATTKLSYEALNRKFFVGEVISWPSFLRPCKPLSVLSFCVIECRMCVAFFIFFEALEKIFWNSFLGRRGGSSFAIFGLCDGLCELQMCLHLWAECQLRDFPMK